MEVFVLRDKILDSTNTLTFTLLSGTKGSTGLCQAHNGSHVSIIRRGCYASISKYSVWLPASCNSSQPSDKWLETQQNSWGIKMGSLIPHFRAPSKDTSQLFTTLLCSMPARKLFKWHPYSKVAELPPSSHMWGLQQHSVKMSAPIFSRGGSWGGMGATEWQAGHGSHLQHLPQPCANAPAHHQHQALHMQLTRLACVTSSPKNE